MYANGNGHILLRDAMPSDLDAVIALDDSGNADEKLAYWRRVFGHYASCDKKERHFLVAELDENVVGFIIGEVRAWEFGSPPTGWVFTLLVSPAVRQMGIGRLMFEEICKSLKRVGVATVRTMVEHHNKLNLSFFRGQGLSNGRYIELEKSLY